jgi:hypothetical protein
MVPSRILIHSEGLVLTFTMVHSYFLAPSVSRDSFILLDALGDNDSFRKHGALSHIDSFNSSGTRGSMDSFSKDGPLIEDDSFDSSGVLPDKDSLTYLGTLIICDSFASAGALPHQGFAHAGVIPSTPLAFGAGIGLSIMSACPRMAIGYGSGAGFPKYC